jgi:hypothetical protein
MRTGHEALGLVFDHPSSTRYGGVVNITRRRDHINVKY